MIDITVRKMIGHINSEIESLVKGSTHSLRVAEIRGAVKLLAAMTGKDYILTEKGLVEAEAMQEAMDLLEKVGKANDAIRELVDELVCAKKSKVGSENCPRRCQGQECTGKSNCEECKEEFYNEMRDSLLKQYFV